MSAAGLPSPARLPKRSRASDAAHGNMANTKKERVKRRRTSTGEEELGERLKPGSALVLSESSELCHAVSASNELPLRISDKGVTAPSKSWSLSQGVAGQFAGLDPILTPDEQYLLLSLETSIHVYSVATARLFRILEPSSSETIIGFHLSPTNKERLHIITSAGSVSEWDWSINKQLASWSTQHKTIAAHVVSENAADEEGSRILLFSLRERRDGKRELAVTPLNEGEPQSTSVLETNIRVEDFRVIGDGRIAVVYGGTHLFVGSSSHAEGSEFSNYVWREVKLGVNISCVDVKQHGTSKQTHQRVSGTKKLPNFDLAVGGADGSILVYHGASNLLGALSKHDEDKKSAPRRLHWHRDSVTAVHWSRDGNYLISGGHESVMVLWQLDTGRKQFLPHLSSPICNIVVADSGNSYAVKLADNRVVVLSARELQPMATIIGLQLCARASKTAVQATAKSFQSLRAVAAALHPQHPEQLLITVPASHQITQDSIALTSAPVLQTYDIRTNTHISRQALARTNATTLNISPDGSPILTPDIKHMSISQDGKWMATVDSWSPYPQDMEALDFKTNVRSEYEEIYIKFWRWSESSSLWELATRIDKPHLSGKGSASVLSMSSRPHSHEFATIGSDALLRIWRPVIRQRYGRNKDNSEQVPETWKCRDTVDLSGYFERTSAHPASLSSASSCFSEDGSVLAICLQSASTIPGLAILLDVQSGSVRHSKAGVYYGDICATSFLGCQLIIATKRSVFAWDTVNDVVKSTDSPEVQSLSGDSSQRLLAVNHRTHTFAITSTKGVQKKAGRNKFRKSGYTVQVFDMDSMLLLSRTRLSKEPVALLSSSHSAEYVVVDAGANIQQLGCAGKASQPTHTDGLIESTDLGLEGLFGRQFTGATHKPLAPVVSTGNTQPSERTGLASVFGDTPPFVLPPSRIVFRDLVKALTA
ncbi:quinon protein alcohol dehydrogenase-like superfamily [Aspergillus carlsbadensis]|nr:quinon protein alcohol dehydrogenase-like superfamily [Aspergillus carlsbadensis]